MVNDRVSNRWDTWKKQASAWGLQDLEKVIYTSASILIPLECYKENTFPETL